MMTQGFTAIVMNHFGAVPRQGLIALVIAAATTTIGDLVSLGSGDGIHPIDIVMLAIIVGGYLAATYLCAMGMLKAAPSWASFARYATTQAILWSALIAAFALFVVNPTGDRDTTAGIAFPLLAIGVVAIALLPAWPIGQAAEPPVAPLAVLKATKGHRFWLFVFAFTGSSVSELVPDLDTVTGPLAVSAVLAGNFVVNIGTSLFYTALAVTSWQLSSERISANGTQTVS